MYMNHLNIRELAQIAMSHMPMVSLFESCSLTLPDSTPIDTRQMGGVHLISIEVGSGSIQY